jgi:hypothetical protein
MPQDERHIDIANRIMQLLKDNASKFAPFTAQDIRYEDPDSRNIEFGIVVSPLTEAEGTGTNAQDDIGYRFMIRRSIAKTAPGDMHAAKAKSKFRVTLRKIFHRKRIGIECELLTKLTAGDYVAKRRYKRGSFDVTALIVTTWIRESREQDGE